MEEKRFPWPGQVRKFFYCVMSKPLLRATTFFLLMAFTLGSIAQAAAPHPAVARIIVPEKNGSSLGSGVLVGVNDQYGLVLTNWHVVRDGNGKVTVVLPGGFSSGAVVVKIDRDWDLAALTIQRPNVPPVPISNQIPRPGDSLSIAGYGSGDYRTAGGRCVQYLSPGGDNPFELIELAAGARQGDSGGPIFNRQGQVAGILFGSASGKTSGSHCGRVRQFVDSLPMQFDSYLRPTPAAEGMMIAQERTGRGLSVPKRLPQTSSHASKPSPTQVASSTPAIPPIPATLRAPQAPAAPAADWKISPSSPFPPRPYPGRVPVAAMPAYSGQAAVPQVQTVGDITTTPAESQPAPGVPPASPLQNDVATWLNYTRNGLALVGAFAILCQLARWLAPPG